MAKKELRTYYKQGSQLVSLSFIGGGELPDALKSEFTSIKEAERMRDLYYAGDLPKTQEQLRIAEAARIRHNKTRSKTEAAA